MLVNSEIKSRNKIAESDDWFYLVKEGNRNAFRKVFDRYFGSVNYYAARILNDDTYSEDIAIQSFYKAWEARKKFETPRHLENFLYLVTRNACISYMRSGRVVQNTEYEWSRIAGDEEVFTPLDLERIKTRLIESIHKNLTRLPGGEVLRMSYLEGKSTTEIAQTLNITENNVYIIKSRSLKVLRTMMAKDLN